MFDSAHTALYGLNNVDGSCDGFIIYPTAALGSDYMAMTYYPPSLQSQVGIVATDDDTTVIVVLPDRNYDVSDR